MRQFLGLGLRDAARRDRPAASAGDAPAPPPPVPDAPSTAAPVRDLQSEDGALQAAAERLEQARIAEAARAAELTALRGGREPAEASAPQGSDAPGTRSSSLSERVSSQGGAALKESVLAVSPEDGPDQPDASASVPAWLQPAEGGSFARTSPASTGESLQASRERVASRWYTLRHLLNPEEASGSEPSTEGSGLPRIPVLAVTSLTGGSGKTSVVAGVGRALSAQGEHVLLAEATGVSLLPFFYGAKKASQPGALRTFLPPEGTKDAPVRVLASGTALDADADAPEALRGAVEGVGRILIDLRRGLLDKLQHLRELQLTVLVPLLPDMNSVLTLPELEGALAQLSASQASPILPFFVLNQFDGASALHLDVREALRQKLGERLLPFVIRRAPAVSEALAEGMTVLDYASDSGPSDDYRRLAAWLQRTAPVAASLEGQARWQERRRG